MILSKNKIKHLLRKGYPDGIVVTPILDEDGQIGNSSIDVRLGNEFIVVNKQTGLLAIDPLQKTELTQHLNKYQSRVQIPFESPYYLHPQDFCLARTLEYIAIPENITGYVIGRSSWGRLGLIIATATIIEPGFKGVVVLELANVGNVPIVLYPVMRIAQISFHGVFDQND